MLLLHRVSPPCQPRVPVSPPSALAFLHTRAPSPAPSLHACFLGHARSLCSSSITAAGPSCPPSPPISSSLFFDRSIAFSFWSPFQPLRRPPSLHAALHSPSKPSNKTSNASSRSTQLAIVLSLYQKKRLKGDFLWRMSQELERSDEEIRSKASILLPASDKYIAESIKAIKAGKVIALPTDTLYGFACDACSAAAVNQIYEIKGRKLTSPLAICVADVSDIPRFAVVDGLPHGLLDSLLPGPVTVILKKGDSSILEKSLNPGLDNIGVRVPDYDFICAIARGFGSALALTSANLSGQLGSVGPKDFEHLWHHCAHIFDGGLLLGSRAGSTVVDLTKPGTYKILRTGSAREETVAVLHSFFLKEVL